MIVAYFVLLILPLSFAEEDSGGESPHRKFSMAPFPVLYYTPETRLAYGATVNLFFQPEPDTRPTSIFPVAVYTQNKQIIAKVDYDLYALNEKLHIYGRVGYYDYPETFWGVGHTPREMQEDYTRRQWRFNIYPQVKVLPNLYVGGIYEFENTSFPDTEPQGLIETARVPGSRGGLISGLGLLLNFDTRDHIYFPTKGSYNQVYVTRFAGALGSDYEYSKLQTDLRLYRNVAANHILAARLYNESISGNVPFNRMGWLGGSERMRGFYEGRFRDKHLLILQMEYRLPLTRLFGLDFFGAFGDVAPEFNRFFMNQARFTYGGGVRFQLLEAQKINVRVDYGISEEGGSLYVEIFEAF